MINRSTLLFLMILVTCPLTFAQCPAVEFDSRTTLTTDPSYVQGIVQLSPGSFVGVKIAQQAPYKLIGLVPHMERQLMNCYQKNALGSAAPKFHDYSAGAASMPVNIGRLNAGWTFGGISLSRSRGVPAVNVVAANAPLQITTDTAFNVPEVPVTGLFTDLDKDGFADLVVVYSNPQTKAGGVSVLLGNGDGTFLNPVNYAAGTAPVSVCAGDFNGDGEIDLAVATQSGASVMLLAGDGAGSFGGAQAVATLPTGTIPTSVAAADLNGDGHLDLVVTTQSGVFVLLGSGGGSFTQSPVISLGVRVSFTAIGDFNLDGKPDLAVAYPNISDSPDNSSITVLLGKGDGTFAAPVTYLGPANTSYLVVTDVNGDGNPDIAVAQGTPALFVADDASGKVTTLLGNGDGTFQGSRLYPGNGVPQNMIEADVNGDGKPDLIVVNGVSSFGGSANQVVTPFETFLNQGNGTFSGPITGKAMTLGLSVAAADFNGDGKQDIAVAGANLSVMFGNGDGTFTPAPVLSGTTSAAFVAAGDFNGDGKPDLLIGSNTSGFLAFLGVPPGIAIALNQGNGTFAAPANLGGSTPIAIRTGNLNSSLNPIAIAVGDFNKDGKLDIAVADGGRPFSAAQPGGVVVFLGKGDGTFLTGTELAAGVNPSDIAIGDLNGDGIPDMAVSTGGTIAPTVSGYEIAILIGIGDGNFKPAVFLPTDFGPAGLAIADINGDGKADIVVTHCCGQLTPTYLLGNGDGTFQPDVTLSVGTSPSEVIAADLNGDGRPDLAVLSSTGVAVLINHTAAAGLTSVSAAGFADIPLTPNSIASGFGVGLANDSLQATSTPLPTQLADASISIKDASGVTTPAPLFYASPQQVNYLVPADVAFGLAQLSASASSGTAAETVQIVPFSPSLFLLNSGNLVAGYLTRVTGGVATTEQVYEAGGSGIVPRPIPRASASDQLILTVFGTGLRDYQGAFYVMVGNQFGPVTYAGTQGSFLGLDQVNIQLPSTLPSGTLPIEVGTFAGGFSNTASILIQ